MKFISEEVAQVVQAQIRGNQIPDFYLPILRQQAVRQLIQQAELQYESERMGLKVSDQEFRDELQYGLYKPGFLSRRQMDWRGQIQADAEPGRHHGRKL